MLIEVVCNMLFMSLERHLTCNYILQSISKQQLLVACASSGLRLQFRRLRLRRVRLLDGRPRLRERRLRVSVARVRRAGAVRGARRAQAELGVVLQRRGRGRRGLRRGRGGVRRRGASLRLLLATFLQLLPAVAATVY